MEKDVSFTSVAMFQIHYQYQNDPQELKTKIKIKNEKLKPHQIFQK